MLTNTKQFLFRVYHDAIGRTAEIDINNIVPNLEVPTLPVELSYSDYLCTLPETTLDLVTMATRLAYADALLMVRAYIQFVALWELEEGVPVSESTPVTVFHPFLSTEPTDDGLDFYYEISPVPGDGTMYPVQFGGAVVSSPIPWQGFRCYDLVDSDPTWNEQKLNAEAFLVLDIARQSDQDRARHQHYDRVVTADDYFRSRKWNVVLNCKGTLYNTRFPLWRQVITTLPWQHSGWLLNRDGSISRSDIAQSRRVANGVSVLDVRARMFYRRKHALSYVTALWQHEVKNLMAWLRTNEVNGSPSPAQLQATIPQQYKLTYQRVPHQHLIPAVHRVMRWVNTMGVATGNEYLIVSDPVWSASHRASEFLEIQDELRDENGNVSSYLVHGQTRQMEITEAIIDEIGAVLGVIRDYERQVANFRAMPFPSTTQAQLNHSQKLVDIHNAFALKWPKIQSDVLAVLGLLCSWQLVWDVAENSRGDASNVQRSGTRNLRPRSQFSKLIFGGFNTTQRAPELSGRYSTSYPVMTPFRIWDVDIPPSGISDATLENQRAQSYNELQQFLQLERTMEDSRRQQRKQKRDAQIASIEADIHLFNTPNPNDPWDYRNFSRWKYWTTPLSNEGMAETAVRAIDVPLSINIAKKQHGYGALTKSPAVRKVPGAKVFQELDVPQKTRQGFIVPVVIKRLVKDLSKTYIEYRVDEYKEKVYQDAVAYIFDNEGVYSDRQLWPGFGT
jgi:hypothetical protein